MQPLMLCQVAVQKSWRGRGSFVESFPLFGYDLSDYDELFNEKLDMLLEVKKQTNLTWQGKHTNLLTIALCIREQSKMIFQYG